MNEKSSEAKAPDAVDTTTGKPVAGKDFPAAGPHARPELNDASKTPGAGMLTDPERKETDAPGG